MRDLWIDNVSKGDRGVSVERDNLYACVTCLNRRHMLWAWTSLFMVGFADFYIWMVASGRIADVRIF